MNKFFFTILLILIFGVNIFGQKHDIGVSIGEGQTLIRRSSSNDTPFLLNPFNQKQGNYLLIEGNYRYSPKKAILRFLLGISYSKRSFQNQKYNHFRIPAGMDFVIGKKIKFIAGIGVYYNYLFKYKVDIHVQEDFSNTKRNSQSGVYINWGGEIQLKKNIGISILYRSNYDIIPIYESNFTKGKSTSNFNNFGRDGFLVFGLFYTINN